MPGISKQLIIRNFAQFNLSNHRKINTFKRIGASCFNLHGMCTVDYNSVKCNIHTADTLTRKTNRIGEILFGIGIQCLYRNL